MWRLLWVVLAAATLWAGAAAAQDVAPTFPTPRRTLSVQAPDGVRLQVYEWGNPRGRPILFVHGLYQSARSWTKQVGDPALAARYRLVAFDLRGHGASDKPDGAQSYREGRRWAGDLEAVIDALALDRPVVVAWSYGGRVLNDYLTAEGDGRLGGIVYVAARSTAAGGGGPPDPTAVQANQDALSADPETFRRGTREFVELCFGQPQPAADVDFLTQASLATPPYVRRLLVGRPLAYGPVLGAIRAPVLILQGDRDAVVPPAVSTLTQAAIPGSTLVIYPGVGHSSFWEQPERFDSDLDRFVTLRARQPTAPGPQR